MTPEAEIITTKVESIIAQHAWPKLAEILRLPRLALPAGAISIKMCTLSASGGGGKH